MSKIYGFVDYVQLLNETGMIEIYRTAEAVLRAHPNSSQTGIARVVLKMDGWALEPVIEEN